MTTRDHAPVGAPCWADLWTSDVDGARRFYADLLGWEALEPSAEHGGYFMFTRDGVPVAGGMGPMPGMETQDRWTVYLSTDDIDRVAAAVKDGGGAVAAGPMAVDDLGSNAVMSDPAGAVVGAWQPGTFPGFTVLDEPGAPSWFELHTPDHQAALDFYGPIFGWETDPVPGMPYNTVRGSGDEMVAGVFGSPDERPAWFVYWEVDDVDAAVARVEAGGGTVVDAPVDTPYGRMATVLDPWGAAFKLRTAPSD